MSDIGQPPPPPPSTPPLPTPPGWAPPPPGGEWRSLRGITTALTWLLGIAAVVGAFGVYAFINRTGVENDVLDGNFENAFDINQRIDDANGLIGAAVGLYVLLTLAIAVLVIIWTHRAMKNAAALGRPARFTPGWAIAGWLIPLVNLVIPWLIMLDLWRGSRPPSEKQGSGLVIGWWITYILSGARFGTFGGDANLNNPQETKDIKTSDTVAAAGMALAVVSAFFAIQVLRKISAGQDAARAALTGAAAPPPPAAG